MLFLENIYDICHEAPIYELLYTIYTDSIFIWYFNYESSR